MLFLPARKTQGALYIDSLGRYFRSRMKKLDNGGVCGEEWPTQIESKRLKGADLGSLDRSFFVAPSPPRETSSHLPNAHTAGQWLHRIYWSRVLPEREWPLIGAISILTRRDEFSIFVDMKCVLQGCTRFGSSASQCHCMRPSATPVSDHQIDFETSHQVNMWTLYFRYLFIH